jgi:hypothetical protein
MSEARRRPRRRRPARGGPRPAPRRCCRPRAALGAGQVVHPGRARAGQRQRVHRGAGGLRSGDHRRRGRGGRDGHEHLRDGRGRGGGHLTARHQRGGEGDGKQTVRHRRTPLRDQGGPSGRPHCAWRATVPPRKVSAPGVVGRPRHVSACPGAGAERGCALARARRQLEHQLGARPDRAAPRLARRPAPGRGLPSGIEVYRRAVPLRWGACARVPPGAVRPEELQRRGHPCSGRAAAYRARVPRRRGRRRGGW